MIVCCLLVGQFVAYWSVDRSVDCSIDQSLEEPSPEALRARQSCLDLVDALHLPANTIDRIIDVLGGKDNVAEMTGALG